MPDPPTGRPSPGRAVARQAVARARLLAYSVRSLGFSTMGLIVANSARQQAARWRRRNSMHGAAPVLDPGALRRAERVEHGARFMFERAALEVVFLAPDVARLSWEPGAAPPPYARVEGTPWPAPAVEVSPGARGEPSVLATSAMSVTVSVDGALRVHDSRGTVLRADEPPSRRGREWELRHSMRPGERFSGLGEQAAGVDLRGERLRMWNRDAGGAWGPGDGPLYLGIPVVVATHPDGDVLAFYENPSRATFRFGAPGDRRDERGTATVRFASGMARVYLMVGTVPHLLERYSALTGRPALPARWALGYHHSRWGFRDQGDVAATVEGFATRAVPLSAVHLDIDYMRGYRVFTVDEGRYPDMGRLAERLAVHGARIVTIVDPGVKVDEAYDVYRQGVAGGHFCTDPYGEPVEGVVWPGRTVFPDFTAPATRAWWSAHYEVLTGVGVAGCWHDMNEPTSIALLGDPTLPLSTRHDFDGRGADHGEGHNVYGLLMNRAGHDGLRRALPDRRPFIVSRSGWAGMQRWAWNWTGDAKTSWEALRQQIATVIGLGLSGVPYSGPDIGGFSGVPDDELYLRWLQMAVFLPYCRTHSVIGAPPREPWCFASSGPAVASWIRLRYRLLPYLYTLAHHAAGDGSPLVRPLWWPLPASDDDNEFAPDARIAGRQGAVARPDAPVAGNERGPRGIGEVDDAFLLGSALLVAPVTTPGARTRSVLLPAGHWSPWSGGRRRRGSTVVPLEAPMGRVPVLARAGSIVPLDDGWAEPSGPCRLPGDAEGDGLDGVVARGGPGPADGSPTAGSPSWDHAPRLLAFHCWPSPSNGAHGEHIDDAGDGEGPRRRDVVRLRAAGRTGVVLTWERHGDFPVPERVRVVLHDRRADRASADGTPLRVRVSDGATVVECPPFERLELEGLG